MAGENDAGQLQRLQQDAVDNAGTKCRPQGHGLNVHARAASEKPSIVQMESQPKVTCFGFRRKKQGLTQARPASAEEAHEAVKPAQTYQESRPAPICGAGDFFQSLVFDSPAKEREPQKAGTIEQNGVKDVEGKTEDITLTPKIMASYESISVSSQTNTQPEKPQENGLHSTGLVRRFSETVRDRDREDGADSIVEEEEYDAFGTPQWTVDPHDIFFISRGDGSQKVCRLGKGEYGPVYLGVWQDQEVAVKLARQAPISLKNERQFQANIARLHSLNHPNIVTFLGACCWKGGKRSVLVTEFMDKSDLHMLLSRPDLAPKFAWREHGQTVALDIAHGLGYLHAQGLVHGRVKSTNVLMNKAGVAKLSDVALPKLLSHCKTTPAPQPFPECMADYDSMPGDIFAFGLVLHELLTQEKASEGTLRAIRTPFEAPAKIAYLVECCLDADPSQRPNIDHVISIIGGKK